MDDRSVWASRKLAWARNLLVGLLLVVVGAFAYGFLTRNTLILSLILCPLAPVGLAGYVVYIGSRRRRTDKKTKRLAQVINEAASSLEKTPPQITDFDIRLSTETGFVWQGVVTPFLVATVRLLDHARQVIISEDLGEDSSWTKQGAESPVGDIARRVRAIAISVEENDPVRTFEAIGDLFAQYILLRQQLERSKEIRRTDGDFVQDCMNVSDLLKRGRFLDADAEHEGMVERIQHQASNPRETLKWQALIVYWLWIRLSLIETQSVAEPGRLFVGPSRLLATYVDLVAASYAKRDFVGISQIICESFDWRTRIPRFLIQ